MWWSWLLACGLSGTIDEHQVEHPTSSTVYDVTVYTHPDVPPPARRTVLLVLDGDWYAGMAHRTVDRLAREGFEPPLVVSVGYDGPIERYVDYTPTPGHDGAGGGLDAFAEVLVDGVLPLVETGEGAGSQRRVLFGHSLGGLAVLQLWAAHPDLADRIVAASPALWWDDGVTFATVREADLAGDLVMTVGSLETLSAVGLVEAMAEDLRAVPNVSLDLSVLKGRDHSSVVRPSLEHGLRSLLEER